VVDRKLPSGTVAVRILNDGELVDGGLMMVSLIAVMLSGMVVIVGGRLSLATFDSELATGVASVTGVPNGAAMAAARLPAAGSSRNCALVEPAVVIWEDMLVVAVEKVVGEYEGLPSGVGIMESTTVFVPRGLVATSEVVAARRRMKMLCIFEVFG